MKRIWIYGILLLAVLLARPEHYELGKLVPVEALFIYIDGERVVLETDTGARGTGRTLELALNNMKDTTAGVVFLDTADYLLVGEGAESTIHEMEKHLKPSTRVCGAESGIKVEEAAAFLAVHPPKMTLKVWKNGEIPDKLKICEGRMCMQKK